MVMNLGFTNGYYASYDPTQTKPELLYDGVYPVYKDWDGYKTDPSYVSYDYDSESSKDSTDQSDDQSLVDPGLGVDSTDSNDNSSSDYDYDYEFTHSYDSQEDSHDSMNNDDYDYDYDYDYDLDLDLDLDLDKVIEYFWQTTLRSQ